MGGTPSPCRHEGQGGSLIDKDRFENFGMTPRQLHRACACTTPLTESEKRSQKILAVTSMKRKGNALQNPVVMAVVRGGSYDCASVGIKASALVTPDQISSFISNLNLLDQIGSFDLNHIFAHSQRLNGDAIVAFGRALCKVFTIAAADERKSIVLLAFGTMEKIVRDYFPYITETETTTFTDCVKCLIAFTNCRFNSDGSLNAIAFLRFCAVKLAEGGLVCYDKNSDGHLGNGDTSDKNNLTEKDDHAFFWLPLLDGLSKLTSDPRPNFRKGMATLLHLAASLGSKLSEAEWKDILVPLKESAASMLPVFSNIIKIMQNVEVPDRNQPYSDGEQYSDHEFINDDEEEANMETASYAIVRMKNDISVQLQIVQCREEQKADSDGVFGNGGAPLGEYAIADSAAEGMLMTGHNL
ncbi:hypothetical protein MUK42_06310 [Musa troglodytarum]|uniref:Uncharacterized protein n=1 Tax=Musa troglodytarum TaxID=320322 RepID=A0A9E7KBN3_9LILI|nr:hypothetical protein MUK42_06310 [Musa troglodytarum]